MWVDVRCDTHLRAGWCNRLLFRRTNDTTGDVEVKCPRCAQVKQVHLQPVFQFST